MKKLLTTKELCEILHVSRQYISRECKKGNIPFLKIGKRLRFRENEIKEYLERKNR